MEYLDHPILVNIADLFSPAAFLELVREMDLVLIQHFPSLQFAHFE